MKPFSFATIATKNITPFINRRTFLISTGIMAPGLARKYEINADMGEGFGRWKMVSFVKSQVD